MHSGDQQKVQQKQQPQDVLCLQQVSTNKGSSATIDAHSSNENADMSYERLRNHEASETAILNEGTDEQLVCVGFCRNTCKNALFFVWCILNVGLPVLLTYWRPKWGIAFRWSRCSLSSSTVVLLKDGNGQYFVTKVITQCVTKHPPEFAYMVMSNGYVTDRAQLTANQQLFFRYFIHQHVKYIWNNRIKAFARLKGYDSNTLCSDFYERFKGFSEESQSERLVIFGQNDINVEVKSYGRLFVEEVFNPFYIFQIFSIILWSNDDYYYYAACIFTLSVVSIAVQLIKTRQQSKTLHDMVASSTANSVAVLRKEETVEVPSVSLVPGDVIVVPPNGCTMVCDAVLVTGNCIVNESMLTGESVPETKTPLLFQDGEIYDATIHKRHTIFSGTKVIQTRYYGSSSVLAVVVRTGFNTAKGELVRSILYPKPIDFKFYRDSMKFIGVLAVVATIGMVYGAVLFIRNHYSFEFVLKRVLDIVTIVVPPALPAAMTVGSVYAQSRLKKEDIFCISPPRINVCGKVKLFCFDKTGTLTEDGLDLWGIVPAADEKFQSCVRNATELPQRSPLLAAMSTCHSLTMIQGELMGDPLDVKMFEATQWEFDEAGSKEFARYDLIAPTVVRPPPPPPPPHPGPSLLTSPSAAQEVFLELKEDNTRFDLLTPTVVKPVTKDTYIDVATDCLEGPVAETELKVPYEIGIVRQFPFSSNLQMMSVVGRTLGEGHMDLYTKGAPEKIMNLCVKSSVPLDYEKLLHSYTVRGYRVIALAWRPLDSKLTWHQVQRIKRDEVEKDLTFLGFLVMQNTLKPETTPVIVKLKAANIRSVMVTGDNLHTAISVARDCAIVPVEHRVLILRAFPPENSMKARIQYDALDAPTEFSHLDDSNSVSLDMENGSLFPYYHFATDGKSFAVTRQYFPDVLRKLAIRGTIFARMAPEQKAQLVELLQEFGYIVGMCGDGANDCGALKTAHVGISLSDSEASVAAPFTSKRQNIECVLTVIREGRCALVTSFSVFKYMALYSIIQFISVLILYSCRTNLSDPQFLYIDLAITTTMAVFMGYTGAYKTLVARRPHGTLLSFTILVSIFSQIFVALFFQVTAYAYLAQQQWYVRVQPLPEAKFSVGYENTVVFCVSSYQYMIVAAVCSKGRPFRKPVLTNVPMVVSIVILTVISTVFMLHPGKDIANFFDLMYIDDATVFKFFLTLLAFPVANFLVSVCIEQFVDSLAFKRVSRVMTCKTKPKNLYKILEAEIEAQRSWPPVGEVTYAGMTSTSTSTTTVMAS